MPPRGPILLTGATGFVGGHVRAELARRFADTEIACPRLDVTDPAALRAAIGAVRPAFCVHLAAVAAIAEAREAPDRAWAINLHGTLGLAAALRDLAPDCHLIYASSADTYGASFRAGRPVDETTPLAPLNTYAATKAAADLALGAMAAEGLRVIRLRPFNHTGPGQGTAFAVPAFARQIARIEAGLAPPVVAVGALDPERDFLDVRDVARAYADTIAHADALPPGAILNIASGTPRRIGDVLADLIGLAGVDVRVEQDPARLRPADILRAVGDAGRARTLIGWHPTITWHETLASVLNDWRARVREGG